MHINDFINSSNGGLDVTIFLFKEVLVGEQNVAGGYLFVGMLVCWSKMMTHEFCKETH